MTPTSSPRPPLTPRARASARPLALASALLLLIGAESAAQATSYERLEWKTAIKHFQVDSDKFVGQRFSFECPERTPRDEIPSIHGTNVYPSTTPLCVAAVHSGAVGWKGGKITVQLNPGLDAYTGAKKHGVTSTPFPGTSRSIVFLGKAFAQRLTPIQREYAPRLKWSTKFTTTGLAYRKLVGQRFVFHCPPAPDKLPGRRVYGTDRYAFNSYVCLTAVHAGRLTPSGGFVAVEMIEPQGQLEGSHRHGIESKSAGPGDRQLIFPALPAEIAKTGADAPAETP
ncbi:MAG: LCCL domain-containing protein [Myxococcota bacterium]